MKGMQNTAFSQKIGIRPQIKCSVSLGTLSPRDLPRSYSRLRLL